MAIPKIKQGTIVEIEWCDASTQDGWVDIKDVEHGLSKVETIGYLYKQDEEVITVIFSKGEGDEVLSPFGIPTNAITSIRELK